MMDQKVTRAFAAGIFLTTVVIYGYLNIFSQDIEQGQKQVKNSEIIEVKRSDYKQLENEVNEWRNKYEAVVKEKTERSDETTTNNEKVKFLLTIKQGMNSKEISKQLEQAGLIESSTDFDHYLEENNVQHLIQIGQYKLHSDMDLKEISEVITKKSSPLR